MARGSRSNTSAATRDPLLRSLTQWSLPLPSGHLQVPGLGNPFDLSQVEDGRRWHPDPDHGPLTIGGRWARVVVHKRPVIARSQALNPLGFRGFPRAVQVPVGVQFHSPLKVVTCVRRKVRRAVIFAKKKSGRGVKRRRPRRTFRSEIWC